MVSKFYCFKCKTCLFCSVKLVFVQSESTSSPARLCMFFKYFCLGSPDTISSSAWNLFIMNHALQSILCEQKSVFISCVITVNGSNRNISLASMHLKCSFRSLFPEQCCWINWETTHTSRRSWKFADVDHLHLSIKIRKVIRLLVQKAFEKKF